MRTPSYEDGLFDEFECERGDEILVTMLSWEKYDSYRSSTNENMRGRATGKAIATGFKFDDMPVACHGITQLDAQQFIDNKTCIATVTGITEVKSPNTRSVILQLRDPKLPKALPRVIAQEGEEDNLVGVKNHLIVGPQGTLIPLKEFKELTSAGCLYCSDPLDINYPDRIIWVSWGHGSDDCPLCERCGNSPTVRQELQLEEIATSPALQHTAKPH